MSKHFVSYNQHCFVFTDKIPGEDSAGSSSGKNVATIVVVTLLFVALVAVLMVVIIRSKILKHAFIAEALPKFNTQSSGVYRKENKSSPQGPTRVAPKPPIVSGPIGPSGTPDLVHSTRATDWNQRSASGSSLSSPPHSPPDLPVYANYSDSISHPNNKPTPTPSPYVNPMPNPYPSKNSYPYSKPSSSSPAPSKAGYLSMTKSNPSSSHSSPMISKTDKSHMVTYTPPAVRRCQDAHGISQDANRDSTYSQDSSIHGSVSSLKALFEPGKSSKASPLAESSPASAGKKSKPLPSLPFQKKQPPPPQPSRSPCYMNTGSHFMY